jgi:hypothetical protein
MSGELQKQKTKTIFEEKIKTFFAEKLKMCYVSLRPFYSISNL